MNQFRIEISCVGVKRISDMLDIITSIPVLVILTGFIWSLLFCIKISTKKHCEKMQVSQLICKFIPQILFAEYFVLLAKITIFPGHIFFKADPYVYSRDTLVIYFGTGFSTINLLPLKSILETFKYGFIYGVYQNLGNILLFVPFGFLVKILNSKTSSKKVILYGFAVSCGLELVQIFEPRSVDIDDVILNMIGVLLGLFIFNKIRPILLEMSEHHFHILGDQEEH